jgi:hypothetical protein
MLNNHPWHSQPAANQTIYTSRFTGSDQPALKHALETCATKAVGLLELNIEQDSLYLLFEWNPLAAMLTIVVTDADKTRDSAYKVQASFPDLLPASTDESLPDTIKFLLSDFLASYSPFFSYSLVAIFHSSNRQETSLL